MAAHKKTCAYCGCEFYGRIDAQYCSVNHKTYARIKRNRQKRKGEK